jgi:hypothetical protein
MMKLRPVCCRGVEGYCNLNKIENGSSTLVPFLNALLYRGVGHEGGMVSYRADLQCMLDVRICCPIW